LLADSNTAIHTHMFEPAKNLRKSKSKNRTQQIKQQRKKIRNLKAVSGCNSATEKRRRRTIELYK